MVDLVENRRSTALTWFGGNARLGAVRTGAGGPQGVTEAPGSLQPVTLTRMLPAGATQLRTQTRPGGTAPARVDALLLRPVVSQLVLAGEDTATALLHSAARRTTTVEVTLPGAGQAVVTSYDRRGRERRQSVATGDSVEAHVQAGGFTVVSR